VNASVEWLVAWRYLRDRDRPTYVALGIGLGLLALSGLLWAVAGLVPKEATLSWGGMTIHGSILAARQALGLAGLLTTLFGASLVFFNLFTTISIFGVFLGVTALIVVLSVMSGFEADLERKILGNNAHILVKGREINNEAKILADLGVKQDRGKNQGETHWDASVRAVVPNVVAVSPYLQSEVILTGPKTHTGVYLKGIIPSEANRVYDLAKNIVEGVLSNLSHPGRLRYLYFPPSEYEVVPDQPSLPDVTPLSVSQNQLVRPMAKEAVSSRPSISATNVPPISPNQATDPSQTARTDQRPKPIPGRKAINPLLPAPGPSTDGARHPGGLLAVIDQAAQEPIQKAPAKAGSGTKAVPGGKSAPKKPGKVPLSGNRHTKTAQNFGPSGKTRTAPFHRPPRAPTHGSNPSQPRVPNGAPSGAPTDIKNLEALMGPLTLPKQDMGSATNLANQPMPPGFLAADQRVYPGMILGKELAKSLGLTLGQTVDAISTANGAMGPMGPVPTVKTFRVGGIFYSGHYEFDSEYAYILLREAQDFLAKKGKITGVEIRVSKTNLVNKVAKKLRSNLPPGSHLSVLTWRQVHQNLFSALKLEKLAMFLVLAIIVCVASFSIGANLIMIVRKKRQEIAIIKAMGADDSQVYRIFVIKGLYIGVIGLLLGLGVGLSACAYLAWFGLPLDPDVYYISRLPVRVD